MFEFVVSDKGGFESLRSTDVDCESQKRAVKYNRGKLFDIVDKQIVLEYIESVCPHLFDV